MPKSSGSLSGSVSAAASIVEASTLPSSFEGVGSARDVTSVSSASA